MKVQQIDTKNGKTWQVDGYLISDHQQIRIKSGDLIVKGQHSNGLITRVCYLRTAKVNTIKKQLPTL